MPEYVNPWPHSVELLGPNRERIRLKGKSRKHLDAYFDRYVDRGYIERADAAPAPPQPPTIQPAQPHVKQSRVPVNRLQIRPRTGNKTPIQTTVKAQRTTQIPDPTPQPQAKQAPLPKAPRTHAKPSSEIVPTAKGLRRQPVVTENRIAKRPSVGVGRVRSKKLVGRVISGDALKIYKENSAQAPYRISNGVGIGVMSYNRGKSLKRFVDSVKRTVDLNQVTLFISDDGSTDPETLEVLRQIASDSRIVVIQNDANVGIAGNSNRLLRCLSRFDHMFLCNDDVEFLQPGWIEFYIRASKQSGFHHFCYRQPKIYNAKIGTEKTYKGVRMFQVADKPHGAMLYMTNECFKKIGYFDSQYEKYGFEHIDWSMRPAEFGFQPNGFYDVAGSTEYVRIYPEATTITDKPRLYVENRERFENRKIGEYVAACSNSLVPKMSYIIPCRDIDRSESIDTVVKGVIGQSFPEIEVWLVEQDTTQKINHNKYKSINYLFVDGGGRHLFNKSRAFNAAANLCTAESVILHDADMLSRVDYTNRVHTLLQTHGAVHICGKVIYLNLESTNRVNNANFVPDDVQFERIVGYFEGGSLACRLSTFWQIGAFNEDFWGYGCEDCDFYSRLSSVRSWLCNEEFDLIHLWHSRTEGWDDHHKQNKNMEARLNTMTIEQRIKLQHQQLVARKYGHNLP